MSIFLDVLKGDTVSPPPVWMMRQAGRYLPEYRATREKAGGFLDLCFDVELATEVTLQPIRRFGFDASILFSDILVIPLALGQKVWFAPGEGPRMEAITTLDDLPERSNAEAIDVLKPVTQIVTKLRSNLPGDVALIGFCGAPWTVASYMIAGRGTPDLAPLRSFAANQPDEMQRIIDRLVDVSIAYLKAQIDAGAQTVQIFESWAQVLKGDDFKRWSLDPLSRMAEAIHANNPDIPIIIFPRKAENEGYEAIARLDSVSGISIDSDFDLAFAADRLQPYAAVQGNLDPMELVEGPSAIDRRMDRLTKHLAGGRWIANLGHGIVPETPIEHVEHFIARVRGG